MTDDLVKRLSFLADRIELGDRLRWGEDSAALRDAKDRIEELEAKLAQQDDLVQAAVAAERERCAKVAQQHAQIAQEQVTRLMKEHGSKTAENIWTGRLVAAQEVEATIRKGGE